MGFKILNFSLKVLIKTGSSMWVSTVLHVLKLVSLKKNLHFKKIGLCFKRNKIRNPQIKTLLKIKLFEIKQFHVTIMCLLFMVSKYQFHLFRPRSSEQLVTHKNRKQTASKVFKRN